MSTPSCQISTPNRIVVFEYEVLQVFVCKSDTFFLVRPVVKEQGIKSKGQDFFVSGPSPPQGMALPFFLQVWT